MEGDKVLRAIEVLTDQVRHANSLATQTFELAKRADERAEKALVLAEEATHRSEGALSLAQDLQTRMYGSKIPGPLSKPPASSLSVVGRLVSSETAIGENVQQDATQDRRLTAMAAQVDALAKAKGIDKNGVKTQSFLGTREGRQFALTALGTVCAMVAAIAASIIASRAPAPPQPAFVLPPSGVSR